MGTENKDSEKIKIYLTDQARGRKAGRVTDLSQEIMISVTDFYEQPRSAEGFREKYGMKNIHRAGWDSGGFQFLMLKLKGMPMETLPCGIDVPVDASRTIDLYKKVGAKLDDLPIQLDLPPRLDLPPESRRQLIERSARYYWEMVPEIPNTVPTIHGWTFNEIKYNLELVTDPDKLAAGSYISTTNDWTMGNMNPHNGRVAAGTFNQPAKSLVESEETGVEKRKNSIIGSRVTGSERGNGVCRPREVKAQSSNTNTRRGRDRCG
jgi:hypothetical protein